MSGSYNFDEFLMSLSNNDARTRKTTAIKPLGQVDGWFLLLLSSKHSVSPQSPSPLSRLGW